VVETFADGHRHLQRGLRRHWLAVGGSANPVRAEELPRHPAPPKDLDSSGCQAPGWGSGSRPLGRPDGGTELRLPGRTSSVVGAAGEPRAIRSPLITRRISSADSVSYSSSP